MARIKIRLRFNPGRLGSPMGKLGEFATQTDRFLRKLSADFGLDDKNARWLAHNFTNESVAFDSEFSESVADDVARQAQRALSVLSSDDPLEACNSGLLSYATVAEFSKIGKVLDADEFFLVGLYEVDKADIDWRAISHQKTSEIRQFLEVPIAMHGSVQGIMHSWHQGADHPFFSLRQLSDSELVRCEYPDRLYPRIHGATQTPNAVIHAYGDVFWDKATNALIKLSVSDVEVADTLSEFEFQTFFGSSPEFTGSLGTSEYVAWLRGDDGDEN